MIENYAVIGLAISLLFNLYFMVKISNMQALIDEIREDCKARIENILKEKAEELILVTEKKAKETLTVDAQQILHDLTHGGAVVKVTPIDPTQLFYRAPRG